MKRTYILLLLMAAPLLLNAQKRKAKAPVKTVTEQVQDALASYQFGTAEELLNKEIATLKKRRKDTSKLEQLLQKARTGAAKLHATERIVIIDSVVCPKAEALQVIRLSRESGRIDTYASTYHTDAASDATIYENELANKRYVAIEVAADEADGEATALRLAVSDKIGDGWSKPTPLTGLNQDDLAQNYPFLLSDGLTLYYAATGPESMGGYDIFVTRADGEGGSFLAPENVGFPFNSTANDYLLVIDELNQLGWFISDRRQPKDKVCVYTFIPNETREVYGDEVTEKQLQQLARITSIRATWNEETEAALTRLQAVRNGKTVQVVKTDFVFPIDNRRIYYRMSDFRSPIASFKMPQWLRLSKALSTDNILLERLREKYASASDKERKQIAPTIQRMEASVLAQEQAVNQLAKEIRNAEISHR